MTHAAWHGWCPITWVCFGKHYFTSSHLPRVAIPRNQSGLFFSAVVFPLHLLREIRVARHGLYSLVVIQDPHLHQVSLTTNRVGSPYPVASSLSAVFTHSAYASLVIRNRVRTRIMNRVIGKTSVRNSSLCHPALPVSLHLPTRNISPSFPNDAIGPECQ